MSFQAVTWAVDQELPALQKLVLLMLANCSNHHTGQCNPSHERLARECGMSRDSVKRSINELAAAGLLEIVRRSAEGISLPNQYCLQIGGAGAHSTGGGCTQHRGVGADSTTNQEVKPGSETVNVLEVEFEAFWKAYPRKTAKEGARKAFVRIKPSAELRSKIMAALEKQKRTEQWRRDPQFIPHASTWLNQKRWEDEVQEAKPVRPTVVDEWWKTNQGIERRGRELGVQPGRMDWSAWRDAIFAAEKKLKGDAP